MQQAGEQRRPCPGPNTLVVLPRDQSVAVDEPVRLLGALVELVRPDDAVVPVARTEPAAQGPSKKTPARAMCSGLIDRRARFSRPGTSTVLTPAGGFTVVLTGRRLNAGV